MATHLISSYVYVNFFFLFVLAIAPVKAHFLTVKYGYFSSLFTMALIRRAPKRGTSNEYP